MDLISDTINLIRSQWYGVPGIRHIWHHPLEQDSLVLRQGQNGLFVARLHNANVSYRVRGPVGAEDGTVEALRTMTPTIISRNPLIVHFA